MRANAGRRFTRAAAAYDAKLAKIGKLQRLETYTGSDIPILHRCLEHGEEHRTAPDGPLQGRGLRCCQEAARRDAPRVNTLASVILRDFGPELLEPCQFYLYAVHGKPGLVKPGIARDHTRRAADAGSRGLYGEPLAVWDLLSRRDALLIEGAILRDPTIRLPADPGQLQGLNGAGEVRQMDAEALVCHAQRLVDSLADHDGPWQSWALENVPTFTRVERIALRRQLAAWRSL